MTWRLNFSGLRESTSPPTQPPRRRRWISRPPTSQYPMTASTNFMSPAPARLFSFISSTLMSISFSDAFTWITWRWVMLSTSISFSDRRKFGSDIMPFADAHDTSLNHNQNSSE